MSKMATCIMSWHSMFAQHMYRALGKFAALKCSAPKLNKSYITGDM